ncbi:MAG: hypothetical protein AUJ74_01055 [Candidatus Omnitrophica bacterium CG1_02_44_16]|nr:MAG: hypothetical protein AUJ74_01055 [Candidatus Omnitrophica bacterium CG1_02_44_16]PIY82422.1 MAG: hypothetical protein COY78_06185 [Candidatus Omnitrophica bacterium CG_4_10_14_0_8_um_filter_44_12]PIZ84689.1 MAG: hypothetical protein COX96_02755 [Candidatus Omnitrophica bacterium CG_4_10_14_0_2_um_filter_44_9]
MRKLIVLNVLAMLVFCGGAFAEQKTIKGEVIDVSCYVAAGAKGEAHKECAIACIKAGQPAGILEEITGKVYIAAKEEDHMNNPGAELLPYVAKMVEVKGDVKERGGVAIVDVKEIKELGNAVPMMDKKGSGMMEEKKGSGN